jgi:hypothetical protein
MKQEHIPQFGYRPTCSSVHEIAQRLLDDSREFPFENELVEFYHLRYEEGRGTVDLFKELMSLPIEKSLKDEMIDALSVVTATDQPADTLVSYQFTLLSESEARNYFSLIQKLRNDYESRSN